jgi:hypothetical protein
MLNLELIVVAGAVELGPEIEDEIRKADAGRAGVGASE